MALDTTNDIQEAFLEGIEEVYSIMFTQHCFIHFLDEEQTQTNDLYGETKEKVYKEPIEIVAKIEQFPNKGESEEETILRKATITVPTKQFLDKEIPCLFESDWEELRKVKFSYEGTEYLVNVVKPKTLVADIWQFFEFKCTEGKQRSI